MVDYFEARRRKEAGLRVGMREHMMLTGHYRFLMTSPLPTQKIQESDPIPDDVTSCAECGEVLSYYRP